MTDVNDLRLYVRYDEGEGPAIVYLHGFNSDATDWRKVIDTIGPGYRHIALDLLGFGESPKPTDIDYTTDQLVLIVYNTLRELKINGRILLVGYSLGGDIAVRYASTHPQELRRLFLLSAPFYLPPDVFAERGFGTEYLQVILFKWVWRFISGSKANDNALYELTTGKFEGAAKQFFRTDDVPKNWDVMRLYLTNVISKADFVNDLPKLSMPTTFALGVRDPIVHPDQTPELKALKPDMEIRRITGLTADHFMLAALPEKVAHEIMRDEIRPLHLAIHEGSGDAVVLLHDLENTGGAWQPVADALATTHEVIAPDLLGFGESEKPSALLYTLSDHAAAVWSTIRRTFGDDRAVTLVGSGLGANIALEVAAERPEQVREVVGFSPDLVPEGFDLADAAKDNPQAAQLLATRKGLSDLTSDATVDAIITDQHAQRVTPVMRSLDNSVLAVKPTPLIEGVKVPVRFVVGADDPSTPRELLEREASDRDTVTVTEIEGGANVAFDSPGVALKAIDPSASDAMVATAAAGKPAKPNKAVATLKDAFRSANNLLFVRGLIAFVGGAILLAMRNVPPRLITFVFGIWVLVEGVTTIVGAIGLAREKKSWITFGLVGTLTAAVGVFLVARTQYTLWIVGIYIAVRALYTGVADIVVARKVKSGPKPQWFLWGEGVLGIVIAFTILFVPQVGGPLLRLTLAAYLMVAGALRMGYVIGIRHRTNVLARQMLDSAKTVR